MNNLPQVNIISKDIFQKDQIALYEERHRGVGRGWWHRVQRGTREIKSKDKTSKRRNSVWCSGRNRIRLGSSPRVTSGGFYQSTRSDGGTAIAARGQAHDQLVPPGGGQKPEIDATLQNNAPQDHSGLTGFLSEVATLLNNVEALRPVVTTKRDTDRKTCSWDRLPPTAQRLILAASAVNGIIIPSEPSPFLHFLLNARNARNTTALQYNCTLTYLGNNIFLPTDFCQDLLQDHIISITDPNATKYLSPLLIHPSSTGSENYQQISIRVQVLIPMGQYRLSKEEADKILDQRFHMVAATQKLRHNTQNFLRLTGYFLGTERPLSWATATWPCHIYLFECQ